jgi:hypothetical protein
MRLKVGDDFLDSNFSIIAQTYAVNEIGSIETRQGGFSNNFTIPLTNKNKLILGFPDDINTASRNAYEKIDATLYDNAVPVAFGYLRYQVVDALNLQASFFSDNSNWFNLLKDKLLTDLDLSDLNHQWAATAMKTAIDADKTSGYTYPLIDYGEFSAIAHAGGIIEVDEVDMFPATFVSTLLQQVYFDIGWKADGDVLDSAIYKRMIIPFSAANMRHTTQWVTDETISDATVVDQTANYLWTSIVFDSGTNFTMTQTSTYTIAVSVIASLSGVGGHLAVALVRSSGVTIKYNNFDSWIGTETKTIVAEDVELDAGEYFYLRVGVDSGKTAEIYTGSTIVITPGLEVERENEIQMSALQPNIKQVDFLKYVAFLFGAVLQANALSKTVTWSYFRDIKKNTSVDWSDKIDLSKSRDVNFTELLDNYAQVSILNYSEDSNDPDLVNYENNNEKRFGQGQFDINNSHLKGRDTIFETPFTAMTNKYSFNGDLYIPSIPWISAGKRGKMLPKIALLSSNILLSDYNAAVTSLKILQPPGSSSVSAISFCWFAKQKYISAVDAILDSLVFDQVNLTDVIGDTCKDRFLIDYEDILNSMRYLKAFVLLSEVDISTLDFTQPVYLEKYKSYFYISKILNYQGSTQTTEVELTKI